MFIIWRIPDDFILQDTYTIYSSVHKSFVNFMNNAIQNLNRDAQILCQNLRYELVRNLSYSDILYLSMNKVCQFIVLLGNENK